MDAKFTISESTNKLLSVCRDFDRAFNGLYSYFQDIEEDEEKKDDEAERRFKPFNQSAIYIKGKLLGLIQYNIERALETEETEI